VASFRRADTPEYEAKCERCGISCHAAVVLDGRQIVLEGLHCTFFGEGVGCTVYADRFERAPWCLHSLPADTMGALREGCPYQSGRGARGKERVEPEEYRVLWPRLAEALLAIPSPTPHFTWPKFVGRLADVDPDFRWKLETNVTGSIRLHRKKKLWTRVKEILA
jgi:hypothetical protein